MSQILSPSVVELSVGVRSVWRRWRRVQAVCVEPLQGGRLWLPFLGVNTDGDAFALGTSGDVVRVFDDAVLDTVLGEEYDRYPLMWSGDLPADLAVCVGFGRVLRVDSKTGKVTLRGFEGVDSLMDGDKLQEFYATLEWLQRRFEPVAQDVATSESGSSEEDDEAAAAYQAEQEELHRRRVEAAVTDIVPDDSVGRCRCEALVARLRVTGRISADAQQVLWALHQYSDGWWSCSELAILARLTSDKAWDATWVLAPLTAMYQVMTSSPVDVAAARAAAVEVALTAHRLRVVESHWAVLLAFDMASPAARLTPALLGSAEALVEALRKSATWAADVAEEVAVHSGTVAEVLVSVSHDTAVRPTFLWASWLVEAYCWPLWQWGSVPIVHAGEATWGVGAAILAWIVAVFTFEKNRSNWVYIYDSTRVRKMSEAEASMEFVEGWDADCTGVRARFPLHYGVPTAGASSPVTLCSLSDLGLLMLTGTHPTRYAREEGEWVPSQFLGKDWGANGCSIWVEVGPHMRERTYINRLDTLGELVSFVRDEPEVYFLWYGLNLYCTK